MMLDNYTVLYLHTEGFHLPQGGSYYILKLKDLKLSEF